MTEKLSGILDQRAKVHGIDASQTYLAPALKRGVERVKRGEPVMIDVITQPRG